MKNNERKRRLSIGRRIINKMENIVLGIGLVSFVYCAVIRRSFGYGKENKH